MTDAQAYICCRFCPMKFPTIIHGITQREEAMHKLLRHVAKKHYTQSRAIQKYAAEAGRKYAVADVRKVHNEALTNH